MRASEITIEEIKTWAESEANGTETNGLLNCNDYDDVLRLLYQNSSLLYFANGMNTWALNRDVVDWLEAEGDEFAEGL